MKKSKISRYLYVPIKEGKYLLNGKGIVRVYKSMETLKKYCKGYDNVVKYERIYPTATEIYEQYKAFERKIFKEYYEK